MDMNITEVRRKSALVLNPHGWVDATNADVLRKKLDEYLVTSGSNIIINMKHLQYVSSAGWAALLELAKKVRSKGGNLRFASMNEEVFEVFNSMGLDKVVEAYKTEREALKSFRMH